MGASMGILLGAHDQPNPGAAKEASAVAESRWRSTSGVPGYTAALRLTLVKNGPSSSSPPRRRVPSNRGSVSLSRGVLMTLSGDQGERRVR